MELGVEAVLASEGRPFSEKYAVLHRRLFDQEYTYWAGQFPGGNDHGPGHIQRVMEKLDLLVGVDPIGQGKLTIYELFLAMMAILYHDVGILRGRKDHAQKSGDILGDDPNAYLFDQNDKAIIAAAVVAHSSHTDIVEKTSALPETVTVGSFTARPRVVAALVRLADELDEDYRRADPVVEATLQLNETSRFYWHFSQRISGVRPDAATKQIVVDVAFVPQDLSDIVHIDENARPFVVAFAEKLAKINTERIKVNQFLPDDLRYKELAVVLRPLPGHRTWKTPRTFVFGNGTTAEDFLVAFPELLLEPANRQMETMLRHMREGDLDAASDILRVFESVVEVLPASVRTRVHYDRACVESLRAESAAGRDQDASLDRSLDAFHLWIDDGLAGSWESLGLSAYNEVYNKSRDGDLTALLGARRVELLALLPEDLRPAVADAEPVKRPSSGGGSGCVPRHTRVLTPSGMVPAESLREGDKILSVDVTSLSTLITCVIARHAKRSDQLVTINGRHRLTPSQPLLTEDGAWINAGAITIGMRLRGRDGHVEEVLKTETSRGYYEVFTLTTDDDSHNFILSEGLVCRNKHPGFDDLRII